MPSSGPAQDSARRLVVERSLGRKAFEHLTVDAFMALPFEALGPTKALLKRFFSAEAWGPEEDATLSAAVGPGEGFWSRPLDDDVTLEYGWDGGRFLIRVASSPAGAAPEAARPRPDDPLAASFDGPVVPEATPNPRTIRFHVGPQNEGPSRWYESPAKVDDPKVSRLFAQFQQVANVLVGPDFVAVSLRRAADWEQLLGPILALVTEEFGVVDAVDDDGEETARTMGGPSGAGTPSGGTSANRRPSRLEQAWRDLGSLHPADPADLALVQAAARGDDPFRRQVAANLLREADQGEAAAIWAELVKDGARSVRRAAVDAMVDVKREELRPLLEVSLSDRDPWIRW
ncbi:MAG: NifU N-terminal domain-containing protein, partial [Actinobacteria bacterium]|nr:NifU N-terminal domain-containing protein [Actinomycetota bacterium]